MCKSGRQEKTSWKIERFRHQARQAGCGVRIGQSPCKNSKSLRRNVNILLRSIVKTLSTIALSSALFKISVADSVCTAPPSDQAVHP